MLTIIISSLFHNDSTLKHSYDQGRMDNIMKKHSPNIPPKIICLLFALLFFCLLFSPAKSAENKVISARYSKPRGNNIKWHISIPSPPPAAVIVIQSIPPGTIVETSSPSHQSYDPETGTVKWLLTGVHPGKISMKMKLDTPILKKGEIRGQIIFQDKSKKPIAFVFMTPTKKTRTMAIEGC